MVRDRAGGLFLWGEKSLGGAARRILAPRGTNQPVPIRHALTWLPRPTKLFGSEERNPKEQYYDERQGNHALPLLAGHQSNAASSESALSVSAFSFAVISRTCAAYFLAVCLSDSVGSEMDQEAAMPFLAFGRLLTRPSIGR